MHGDLHQALPTRHTSLRISKNWTSTIRNCPKQENYFVQSLFGQSPPIYTWTGLLESSNGSFQWIDNSPYDYSHFGHSDLRLGSCVTMALQQEIVSAGQWVNANCENNVQFVCKRGKNNADPKLSISLVQPSGPARIQQMVLVLPAPHPRSVMVHNFLTEKEISILLTTQIHTLVIPRPATIF